MGFNYVFIIIDHSWLLSQDNLILPNLLLNNSRNALFKKADVSDVSDCSDCSWVDIWTKEPSKVNTYLTFSEKQNSYPVLSPFFYNMYSPQSATDLLNYLLNLLPLSNNTDCLHIHSHHLSLHWAILSLYITVLTTCSTENLSQVLIWQAMKSINWEINFWCKTETPTYCNT